MLIHKPSKNSPERLFEVGEGNGGAEESRTPDLLGANEALWPTELQPQKGKLLRKCIGFRQFCKAF